MPIDFGDLLSTATFENSEKIEHLAVPARDALATLTDAMEDELERAVEDGDLVRVAKIAWSYGILSAAVTEIETSLLHD